MQVLDCIVPVGSKLPIAPSVSNIGDHNNATVDELCDDNEIQNYPQRRSLKKYTYDLIAIYTYQTILSKENTFMSDSILNYQLKEMIIPKREITDSMCFIIVLRQKIHICKCILLEK